MKPITSLIILSFLFACGSAPENRRGRASIALSQLSAPLVNTSSELPLCDDAKSNELIFVKDKGLFKICQEKTWREVASADAVPTDLRVAEIAKLKSSEFDLCPDAEDVLCYFEGGEYIRYSDGSIKYTARVIRKTSTQNMDDSMRSESSDMLSSQMAQLATSDRSRVKILSDILFKGLTTDVWLNHDSLRKEFFVTVDTNQDGEVSEGDERLFVLEFAAY